MYDRTQGKDYVGIVPSPTRDVPQCEEITTIYFFIQIFNIWDTERTQVNYIGSCLPSGLVWSGILLSQSYITTDGQSVSLSWYQAPIWGLWPDFSTVRPLRVFDMGRPLWREDGSVFYNVQYTIHFTVSDLRPGPCIYIPQGQGGLVIPPGTGYTPTCLVSFSLYLPFI
jgi:hypothetical protein